MATRLKDFAAEVHATLTASGVEAVDHRDDMAALRIQDGRRRIVWIEPGGTIEAPSQAGGRLPSDGTQARARACKMRSANVEAHIFAKNREETELLLDATIAAICTVAGTVEMNAYAWVSEEPNESGTALRSAYCVLRFLLRLPVLDQISPLRDIVDIDETTCGILNDDGTITPQP